MQENMINALASWDRAKQKKESTIGIDNNFSDDFFSNFTGKPKQLK